MVGEKKCRVCGEIGPMVFASEDWCSDRHWKVITKQVIPTVKEWASMDPVLFEELGGRCRG